VTLVIRNHNMHIIIGFVNQLIFSEMGQILARTPFSGLFCIIGPNKIKSIKVSVQFEYP
jgi:hypothetical protein